MALSIFKVKIHPHGWRVTDPDLIDHPSFLGSNGLYLDVADDHSLNSDSREPKPFFIHFKDTGRVTLKTPNGYYAIAEQTGLLKASATEQNATEWEY
jgi:Fascin domain